MSLGNRSDPAHGDIDGHDDDTDDPDCSVGIGGIVPKNHGKDDPAQVATGAREPRHDTVGLRVHVGYNRKVESIGTFEEEGHADAHEADERDERVLVRLADGDKEGSRDDTVAVQQNLLRPD